MRSFRLWAAWPIALALAFLGCGGSEFEAEEPITCEFATVDTEETCAVFCARVLGDCQAFMGFDDAACRRGCDDNIREAFGCSDACGTDVDALFQCVAETDDCQDVYDWRDQSPTDHACRDEVDDAGLSCPF